MSDPGATEGLIEEAWMGFVAEVKGHGRVRLESALVHSAFKRSLSLALQSAERELGEARKALEPSEEQVERAVRAFMDTASFEVGNGEFEAHNLHAAFRRALATRTEEV